MNRRLSAAIPLLLPLLVGGCLKPNTFDPYANPGRDELDRLQRIVDDRPDLETVEQQLAKLDTTIRATVAKYSPQTVFSARKVENPTVGCKDPFTRSIARQQESDHFSGRPAPTDQQWLQIVTELAPVFTAAGFRPNNTAPGIPPPPVGSPNDSQIRDDGALIEFVYHTQLLVYSYDTGCHLPAAWRSEPPPPELRPPNDPDVHYPYLYHSPGGRDVDAY